MLGIVQEVGALAGLAAGVGLAALSALYVAHAREIRRLREWAGRASERPGPAVTGAPADTSAIRRPRPPEPRFSPSTSRRVAAALLVLGAASYGLTNLTGGDGSGRDSASRSKRTGPAVEPARPTVAVLNGTLVPGLAAQLSGRIAAAGFEQGTIDDYSDKQLAASVVQYAPGHQAEATAVSRMLGVGVREPVTADTRALAGDATVIVIAGADQAP